jgi:lipopolysaccharide/colanic/teichoic acid biosynthesis glycosyltransferase
MVDAGVPSAPTTLYARFFKRVFDVVFSLIAILAVLPLMAVVALAVRCVLGRPVIFRDERAGLGGRPIRIAKFRSMSAATDASGTLLPDEHRLGSFGRFLRRTSLDELPQLFSVLAGDMSLIGPRPLPLRYVPRYSPRQAARLLVRPGLAGWAQVHGRNAVDWPQRLELDARYVELLDRATAPLTDLWIAVLTACQLVSQAVTGRGIAAPGVATMQEFMP